MHNFKELKVWQESRMLVKDIYSLTKNLPEIETFGLISQIQRASYSIPSNIAEGAGRNSNKDFIQFLNIATRSAFELETLLLLTQYLNYLTEELSSNVINKIKNIQKMLYGLRSKLDI